MNKKIIIGIVGLVAFLGLLFIISAPSNNTTIGASASQTTAGQISATETSYNFGSISMKKGNVSNTYKVKNSSEFPVEITKLYTSCMCTTAALTIDGKKTGPFGMPGHGGTVPNIAVSLAPGQEGEVELIFDPAAHGSAGIGKIDRTVFIESKGNPNFELTFTALVTP